MDLRFWRKKATVEEVATLECEVVEALGAMSGVLGAIASAIESFEFPALTPPEPVEDQRIVDLQRRMDDLTNAVGDGILRVQRSENRIRAIVDGAKKQLAEAGFEHPGVEAEFNQLRELDGTDQPEEPVPAVPESLELVPGSPSSVPGVTIEQLQRPFTGR